MNPGKVAVALSDRTPSKASRAPGGWLLRVLLIVAGLAWIGYQPERGLFGLLLAVYGMGSLIFGRFHRRSVSSSSDVGRAQAPFFSQSHYEEKDRIEWERAQWRAGDDHSSFHDDGR